MPSETDFDTIEIQAREALDLLGREASASLRRHHEGMQVYDAAFTRSVHEDFQRKAAPYQAILVKIASLRAPHRTFVVSAVEYEVFAHLLE